ncbi:hypothetical protein R1flu_025360 [Riccia fluitans]|uniref:JmjC domain-containing protein n=1 Tax=Riccia fluitans TaxID=41844 RepID=A0ABD1XYF5_9MARC
MEYNKVVPAVEVGDPNENDERGGVGEEKLGQILETLSEEVRELSLGTSGTVDRIKGPPSPLEFLRNYVMPGRPCIITDSLEHWPALRMWSNEYLCSVLKDQPVSVHFTADGRADAVVDPSHLLSTYDCPTIGSPDCSLSQSASSFSKLATEDCSRNFADEEESDDDGLLDQAEDDSPGLGFLFVTAYVEKLLFPEALELIIDGSVGEGQRRGVAYAQQQNGCFLSEYGLLANDAEVHIPWATEALGCMPEAVNLWIGNPGAVTSFHKDHYENLYAVVAGEKHFTLLPPTDVHRMYVRNYSAAHYVRMKDSDRFAIVADSPANTVPWVSVDPYPADIEKAKLKYPRYHGGPAPFICTVRAGELLFLPSMWFHHVRQSPDPEGRTIAINFWYDMQFDISRGLCLSDDRELYQLVRAVGGVSKYCC